MNKINRVVTKVLFVAVAVVGVLDVVDYFYACTLVNADSNLAMVASIEPSMTLTLSDSSKTLNITPSSGGSFGATSVDVGVYSNGSIDYTVMMTPASSSLVGGGTNSVPSLTANSTCSGGSNCTSSNFAPGHWGIAVNTGSTTGVYRPAAATSLGDAVSSSSTAVVGNEYTVYLGANLDLSIPTDIYTNTITFAATPQVATQTITFTFDEHITSLAINDVTGANKATISTSGGSATLDFANTYTIVPTYATNYELDTTTLTGAGFLNGDTLTYIVGSGAGAVTLTSVESGPVKTYMQNISADTLASLMPNVGDEAILYDSRDEKDYTVAHLADGNYWMTQNLDHDIVAQDNYYTPDNTDIPLAWTPSTATYATDDDTWNGSYTAPESYDPGDLCWDGTVNTDWDGDLSNETTTCGSDKHMSIGNYYNWTAALAMNDSSSYGSTSNADANQSICPAGWRLPIGGTTNTGSKSFKSLWDQYSSSFDENTMMNSPLYFSYAGAWYGYSGGVGSSGLYWSSVVGDSFYAYVLGFGTGGGVDPQDYYDRYDGYSVRCVAR